MTGKLSKMAALIGVAASIGIAGPAHAVDPVCVGTQQTAGVCVWATKSTTYQDCVYVGPPPCIPVTVPGYDVGCGGWVGDQWWLQCS